MQDGNDGLGPASRRKRPMVSCRECHRRKEKCDRRQPCSRCMRRGKRNACVYELEHERVGLPPVENRDRLMNCAMQSHPKIRSDVKDEPRILGYANGTKGTPGIIRGLGEPASLWRTSRAHNDLAANQYASIIRELPSRRHIDFLVQAFFQNVAWHYDIVDEATFMAQLSQWSDLSYKQLKLGPDGLPNSLQSFPALLFQVLAQALLFQPKQHDKSLNDLKYTTDMELSDRAAEYSDAGHRIASSFKKSELILTIVQAELMRACFEKTTGAVTDAWHTLGVAIRDAQELGLHQIQPEQSSTSWTEDPECELGGKLWLMLHLWDAHMAIVLGRPMSTRVNSDDFSSSLPSNRHTPKPHDVILCGYHTAYKYLQDIYDLERIDNCRLIVESIHQSVLSNISNLPAWARRHRSRQGEPPWLSAALEMMFTNVQFVLFALHRPFIFMESRSRVAAFHAATQILESQARLFDQTDDVQHKAFGYVFSTFDAMILIIAVHIRFPEGFTEQFSTTKTSLEWALERLKLLQGSNQLASSAFNVAQPLYERMLEVVTATQSSNLHSGGSGTGDWSGIEAEMLRDDWDSDLLLDSGSVLPAQPLSELLCNGTFDMDPAWQTEPSDELCQSQFTLLDSVQEDSQALGRNCR